VDRIVKIRSTFPRDVACQHLLKSVDVYYNLRHDTATSMCAQNITGNQCSIPHVAKTKNEKQETKTKIKRRAEKIGS